MDSNTLEKINRFTRRDFKEEELYVFSVVLCDNDIDRDYERFSDNALDTLKELFIGKTGISDHNPSTHNQNARIFETEIVTDHSRTTKYGSAYKYLKASAYMVRTDENKNLIAEIDGGIKKEVSISCSAGKRICSVCGCDKSVSACSHKNGKIYNNKICHTVLDEIKDAYEWSFVAVPAQVNAGVTKKLSFTADEKSAVNFEYDEKSIKRDIRKFAYFSGGRNAVIVAETAMRNMNPVQLCEFRKSYEKLCGKSGIEVQLMTECKDSSNDDFHLR